MNEKTIGRNILIRKAMQIARKLQSDYGEEIMQLYRSGNTHQDIVSHLSVESFYSIKTSTANTAVQLALRGYKAYFNLSSCSGLLSESELEEIAKKHIKSGWKTSKANKLGIFGWTSEKLKKHWENIGNKAYKDGVGIHGMTNEEKILAGKKGGLATAKKRKEFLWIKKGYTEETRDVTEIERAYQLTSLSGYVHQGGTYDGKADILKILQTINLEYHKGKAIRTKRALERALEKERRKRKNQKILAQNSKV